MREISKGSHIFWSSWPLVVQELPQLPKNKKCQFQFSLLRCQTLRPPTPQLATHLIKNILQPLLRQRRTLHILSPPQLSRQPLPLFLRYQPRRPPSSVAVHHPLHLFWIIPQIHLRAHYQTRRPGTVMWDFVKPLFTDILEWSGRSDGEADEKDVGLGVGQWA